MNAGEEEDREKKTTVGMTVTVEKSHMPILHFFLFLFFRSVSLGKLIVGILRYAVMCMLQFGPPE